MPSPQPPVRSVAEAPVEVRRSKRRKRTVQAYLRDETVVVLLPARMSKAEERYWVAEMVQRLQGQEQRNQRRREASDADLFDRACELSRRYLDSRARPAEVRWVTNQNDRWGSCTPANRSIRLSARLRDLPQWVADYVLVHELAHLLEPGHGSGFWRLVRRYPKTERARGYLEGVSAAAGLCFAPDDELADSAAESSAAESTGSSSTGSADGMGDSDDQPAGSPDRLVDEAGRLIGSSAGMAGEAEPPATASGPDSAIPRSAATDQGVLW